MAMHVYHEGLTGYDERQILHDGCEECEARGADVERALAHLDIGTFTRAWDRARLWNQGKRDETGRISRAEAPTLRILTAVQVHLDRAGIIA